MNVDKKVVIFTSTDLDGAMMCMLFSWFKGTKPIYVPTTRLTFKSALDTFLRTKKISEYDIVYICGLYLDEQCVPLIDYSNVVILNKHTSRFDNKGVYKNAKIFTKAGISCSRLIYELLHKKSVTPLTDSQKYLLLLVDDFCTHTLKLLPSRDLDTLYWNYQGDRIDSFLKEFRQGFTKFNDNQLKIIEFYDRKLSNILLEIETFKATLPIFGKTCKLVSTFATEHINDIADYIIATNECDVGIVINLKLNRVSFRRGKSSDIDLSKLAAAIADGGGHEYSAAGTVTDKFLTFSRLFK